MPNIWTMLGISVGVAGAFCIVAGHLLETFPMLDLWRRTVAAAFAALGTLIWLWGFKRAKTKRLEADEEQSGLGLDACYWGIMFVVMGGIACFIQPLFRFEDKPVTVAARTVPKPPPPPEEPAKPAPPPEVPKAPYVFPKLKLQGVVLRGPQSVAIFDGRSYAIGDEVEGASVREVTREGVMLEHGSETRWFKL